MKKDIEKIVLIVALVLVIAGAGYFAFFFPSPSEVSSSSVKDLQNKPVEVVAADVVGDLQNDWMNPPQWISAEDEHRMFLSNRYLVLPAGNIIAVSPDQILTTNGITLGWAEEFGLDITDGNIELRDPDEDGFYNLLEFIGKASPRDAKSHPPFVSNDPQTSRLRLEGVTDVEFTFQLQSVTPLAGKPVFFLQNKGDAGQRYSVRVTREDSKEVQRKKLNGYILGDYREDKGMRFNKTIGIEQAYDDSELDLLQPEIDRKVTLKMRTATISPDSTADFIMLLPGQMDKPIKVRRADTFSIPQQPDVTYILMDAVQGQGAKIRREDESKAIIEVPAVTSEEKSKVPQEKGDTEENPE